MRKAIRHWSLAARFTAITLVALVAATCVNFAVTFSGPPPMRRPVILTELLPALTGGAAIPQGMPWVTPPAAASRFVPGPGEQPMPRTATALGEIAGLPPGSLRISLSPGRRPGDLHDPTAEARDGFTLGLRRADGSWRVIRGEPAALITEWHWVTFALTLLSALVFGLLAMVAARSFVRPLVRLGREADRVPIERDAPITISGPPEVIRVATAVAAMRDRLANALEDRTAMFTALAHDMTAPVARLRFRFEHLPQCQKEAAERDIAELSEMITGIVEYAAIGRQAIKYHEIDAVKLARDIAARENMAFESDREQAFVLGDTIGLKRVLTNLIVNARRYAGGGDLVAKVDGNTLALTIRDRGPGIPEEFATRVFEPFFRLEGSRNRETAGAGLGFAIARAIAEGNGGTLTYAPRHGGGSEFALLLRLADS